MAQTRTSNKIVQLYEGENAVFVARVTTAGGTPITSSDVSYVGVKLFDMNATAQATEVWAEGPIDPTTVYYDTLQTDDDANLLGDEGGYNFRYILDANNYAMRGGKRYRFQIQSTISGAVHYQVYDIGVGEIL